MLRSSLKPTLGATPSPAQGRRHAGMIAADTDNLVHALAQELLRVAAKMPPRPTLKMVGTHGARCWRRHATTSPPSSTTPMLGFRCLRRMSWACGSRIPRTTGAPRNALSSRRRSWWTDWFLHWRHYPRPTTSSRAPRCAPPPDGVHVRRHAARPSPRAAMRLGVPVYVSLADEEELSDSLIRGKVCLTTFHASKGLERPVREHLRLIIILTSRPDVPAHPGPRRESVYIKQDDTITAARLYLRRGRGRGEASGGEQPQQAIAVTPPAVRRAASGRRRHHRCRRRVRPRGRGAPPTSRARIW